MQLDFPIDHQTIDRINQSCYDNRAEYWDRFPFPDDIPRMLAKYYDPKLGNRVLDVGSGTGVLAAWLAGQGFQVQCIDPSPEMVRRCKEKRLQTIQTTLQNFQPQGQFSMVMAILSLIHLPKSEFDSQIQKLAAALPKGGLLFLGLLEGDNEGIFEGPEFPRFFAYYTPKEVLTKVKPYLTPIDYRSHKSASGGYMLFLFKN